jgi:ketosteroid isomerase-like protein
LASGGLGFIFLSFRSVIAILEAAMSNYADDAVFLAPGAPIVEGKERIRARFAEQKHQPRSPLT